MTPSGRAPLVRRAAAAILDGAIGVAAWALGGLWLIIGLRLLGSPASGAEAVAVQAAALLLLGPALHAVYHVGFVAGCGQTPGRMALGIAVVRRDGGAAGVGRAVARVLGRCGTVLALGLPSLVAFLARSPDGFADWLAGTRVVRVRP